MLLLPNPTLFLIGVLTISLAYIYYILLVKMSNPQRAVCTACLEDKPLADFPGTTLTRNCGHPSSLFLECVTSYINSQIQGTTPEHTRCPECEEQLDYDAIRLFANPELFNL